jgi:hypothetical protein
VADESESPDGISLSLIRFLLCSHRFQKNNEWRLYQGVQPLVADRPSILGRPKQVFTAPNLGILASLPNVSNVLGVTLIY